MTEHSDYISYFEYLDALRESGVTNMWGADEYVASRFGVTEQQSRTILVNWMDTFDDSLTLEERVNRVSL